MKKNTIGLALILLLAVGFAACESVSPTDSLSSGSSYAKPNPYSWAGAQHNAALDYVLTHHSGYVPTPLPNALFNDTIVSLLVDYLHISGQDPTITAQTLTSEIAPISDLLIENALPLLYNRADSVIRYPQVFGTNISSQDSLYVIQILDLVQSIAIDTANYPYADYDGYMVDVYELDSVIRNQTWTSNDFLALSMMSILVNSLEYHNNMTPAAASKIAKMSDRQKRALKIATLGAADFLGGVTAAGVATGASGGIGAGAAVWVGIKAAGAVSGGVSLIFAFFGG